MKKLIGMFFIFGPACAMESMSFEAVHGCISSWSEHKKECFASQYLIGGIALLPTEVRYNIFKQMFNDDDESAKQFNTMPITIVMTRYKQVCHASPLFVGEEMIPVHRLFVLPVDKSEQLIAIGNPSLFAQIMGETNFLVSDKKYNNALEGMPEDIEKTLKKLKIVTKSDQISKLVSAVLSVIGLGYLFFCVKKQYSSPRMFRENGLMRLCRHSFLMLLYK